MILRKKNGVPFLQFENLAGFQETRHGIFTRNGGFSGGPFQSLNVGLAVGDDAGTVQRNRSLILSCLDGDELVTVQQVHGTDVTTFCHTDKEAAPVNTGEPVTADALVTSVSGKALMIQVADCQPVLLYDPVKRVIANVHSGWRGSIHNIIGKTVRVMTEQFDCCARDIVAGVGPSLGQCCAEFIHYRTEIPESFWKYKNESDHFDFWAISQEQLCRAGVPHENISIGGICTRCNPDRFFSYRKERTTGRFAGVILLKNNDFQA